MGSSRAAVLAVTATATAVALLAGTTACGARAIGGHPADTAATAPATRAGTGWIPPWPALSSGAGPEKAPNIVWLDSMGVQQSLLVFRMTSPGQPAVIMATIPPPRNEEFIGVAAAGDDRTFVAASAVSTGKPIRFYELRLDHAGRPGPLIRLRFSRPVFAWSSMVATQDGEEVAGVVGGAGNPGVTVISTATGRVRTWTWSGPEPQHLAWSGDHAIDFVTNTPVGDGSRARLRSSLRRLSTSAAGTGSNLATSRVLVRAFARLGSLPRQSSWLVTDLQAAGTGRTAIAALSSGNGGATRQVLLHMSAVTGRPLRVLTPPAAGWSHDGVYCDLLWSDGSGRHLLVTCGPHTGRVDNGTFTPVRHFEPTQYLLTGFAPFAW
jgi:hypothetical protein